MRGLKNIVWKLLNFIGVGGAINLHLQSGLKDDGWFVSYHKKQSVDKNSKPIPWLNYPFIKFLETRLNKDMDIFEFGCGNSTIWYAQRVKRVTSVEHHEGWFNQIKAQIPQNAQLMLKKLEDDDSYEKSVRTSGDKYQVIIVDGRKRNESIKESLHSIADNGIIILDNSERDNYTSGKMTLTANGFKEIAFWGIAPSAAHNTCTSLFYRPNNCFNI
ncbi:class I SAM-dependent methyltransferase [Microscilla marina]|uniref:Pcmt-protein-L-isoaspartate(D-aspartate) o-methyltransferase, putative n=1 Tax=Microscilla marina ATCC 23134 TaxID=313606 RepID=A1ZU01_MICM2|nr:hypothetical protein [Microscilla marina]EAY26114.1 pcmt - protein-L-isoaspartate(d-aspartate) o-methyltransferase, putative [Microscilla marina ATCC 23134]